MSARFNTKFMIAYIKLYKTFSCPSVSKNVYVGAHTEILLKFAIKIKFLRCSNFSLPKPLSNYFLCFLILVLCWSYSGEIEIRTF